jgi:leucyl aminopeptidase
MCGASCDPWTLCYDDPEFSFDGQALMVKQLATPQLPAQSSIDIQRRGALPGLRALGAIEAWLVVTVSDRRQSAAFLATLPASARWLQLHGSNKPESGSVRGGELPNTAATAAVLGFGSAKFTAFERLQLGGRLWQCLTTRRPQRVGVLIDPALGEVALWYEALISAGLAHSFAMPEFRRAPAPRWRLRSLRLFLSPKLPLAQIVATAEATNLVRWLTALPPNLLNAPGYLRLLRQLARRHGLRLRRYGETDLRRLGAGAFLAVARSNGARDAGIVRLGYRGRRGRVGADDVALIGKGIVFDTGGINLKPHASMLDMHTDMSGSAVALATLIALARLKLPVNVEAWLAISENNTGPLAYRPQEVVRAANGTTIQVIHSDAEGRMVLADTLALAARAKPKLMIDFATLTGACVYALTDRYSGVLSNRSELHAALVAAGVASGERVWPFPLDADFDTDIDSKIADVKQCAADGKGDHILATRFLQRFVPASIPWVHVDLAAATRTGGLAHVPTEITGFGPRFALQFLLAQKAFRARAP